MAEQTLWIATFEEEPQVFRVIERLKDAGHRVEDVHSPYPIHGLDAVLGWRPSRLGWVTFLAGVGGAVGGFGLQAWTSAVDWPINVGGKPDLSTLAFIPVTFESTILAAGVLTAVAFLAKSWLFPRPATATVAERVTDDRFAVVVDPAGELGADELERLLEDAGALEVHGKEAG